MQSQWRMTTGRWVGLCNLKVCLLWIKKNTSKENLSHTVRPRVRGHCNQQCGTSFQIITIRPFCPGQAWACNFVRGHSARVSGGFVLLGYHYGALFKDRRCLKWQVRCVDDSVPDLAVWVCIGCAFGFMQAYYLALIRVHVSPLSGTGDISAVWGVPAFSFYHFGLPSQENEDF